MVRRNEKRDQLLGFCGVEVLWRLAPKRVPGTGVVPQLDLGSKVVSPTAGGSKVVVVRGGGKWGLGKTVSS